MPVNHFRNNRLKVQKTFIDNDFLIPLTEEAIPYLILETKNKAGEGKLRVINIDNIPVTDVNRPISYVLDVELNNKIFSEVQNQKKVEKIFLVFSANSLFVIMVEMKSSLQPSTIYHIDNKIKDTLSRLSLFLPNYILDSALFDNYKINYYCLVFYNNDLKRTDLEEQPALNSHDLIRILREQQISYYVTEKLGQTYKVNVIFRKNNTDNPEELEVNFEEVFANEAEFANAIHSEKTLP